MISPEQIFLSLSGRFFDPFLVKCQYSSYPLLFFYEPSREAFHTGIQPVAGTGACPAGRKGRRANQ
jgi:hypothetical protein